MRPVIDTMPNVELLPHIMVDLDTAAGKDQLERYAKDQVNAGFEGIMIKNVDAPYECKRNTFWMKFKPVYDYDLTVIGIEEGTGKNKGRMGALVCEGIDDNNAVGRSDYVTIIANYQPLQAPYGGPNYFTMDPNALYEIHIDNDGDAREDITFQFKFKNALQSFALPINDSNIPIPLIQKGFLTGNTSVTNLNLRESYTVGVVTGDRRKGVMNMATKVGGGSFTKPVDYIGTKTLGAPQDYEDYAMTHVHAMKLPGCEVDAKVFVGQRQEGFAVNLGTVFDLVNANKDEKQNKDNATNDDCPLLHFFISLFGFLFLGS
jgi:hypothetical protein